MLPAHASPGYASPTAATPSGVRWGKRAAAEVVALLGLVAVTVASLARSDALHEAQAAYVKGDQLTATRRALDHLARRPRSQAAAKLAALSLSRQNYAALAEPHYARAGQLSLGEMHIRAGGLMRCNERLKAIDVFKAILAKQPDDVQALQLEAGVLLTMYRRNDALALATRLTQIRGGEIIGYSMVGFIQHLLQDPESAVAAYEQVLKLDPDLKQTPVPHKQFWLELCGDLLSQGRAVEAKRYATRALGEGQDVELLEVLGQALQQEGSNEEAERAWRKAVELEPKYAPCWLKLGLLALQANRLEEAKDDFERAVACSPKFYSAVYNLSLTYRRMGRSEDAKRTLDRAAQIRREMPRQAGGMGAMPTAEPAP